ncbi:MAG: ribosomal protein S18-alanine N-acetyltransferase [Elusimicrobia bacterium]|nr:ribosomal protein S18-alanine N-acetyltransferase [Elusimicrobiota bacterium]
MENIVIEKMALEDIPAVAAIERASASSPWSEAQFSAELEKPFADFYVARMSGTVAAFAGVWRVAGEVQVVNIAVHPSWRRRGLGRRMLRRACAEDSKLFTLEVRESNQAARRLYESEGFRETSRRPGFYEGKEAAVLMEKNL